MNVFDETVASLERDWPAWQVWYVPCAVGPCTWCARRWDGQGQVLAHSPERLAALLAAT